MTTTTPIKEITVGSEKLILALKGQTPYVEWKDQTFHHLWFLVSQLEQLSDVQHVHAFAEISNFFWKGIQFQYIMDIENYQIRYREQVILERRHPADVFPYRLTDYKIFDVSVMHAPKMEAGQLQYFVYNVTSGLPYKVVCPFPYPHQSTLVHYQILPLLDEF